MFDELSEEVLVELAGKLVDERERTRRKRDASNLPQIWQTAREQFQGVDKENRTPGVEGLASMDSGVRLTGFRPPEDESTRSTVFDNITRSYTETGTSKIADIILPTGRMPWDLTPTKVPDAETLAGVLQKYPEAMAALTPELAEVLAQSPEESAQRVEMAKRHITDYLEECHWMGQVREQILEAGKVGTGVLKGPIPKYCPPREEVRAFVESLPKHIQAELIPSLYYRPYSEVVKVENCYPDPDCGDKVANGNFFWELIPDVSAKRLAELKDDPSYLTDAIELCLEEGPKQPNGKNKAGGKPFELWLRLGFLEVGGKKEFGVVVLCNSRLIKVKEYWLPTPSFPYDLLRWEPREGSWDGIGIPERIETPQRGLNAAIRALHDNLAWSVGPQIIETQGLIEPKDGKWTPHPYKHWVAKKPLFNQEQDPKAALVFLEFPNYSDAILPIINYWLSRAEQVTNLPLLLQGQKSSDSVGVTQQLENNATTNLRQIVKACDDEVFIPHIQRYYEWVQTYGPAEAKADAKVVALGSSTLIVRELQQQVLLQLVDRSLQPQFKLSPARIMAAILEGNQFDVAQLGLTPEEDEELRAAMAQPEPPVQVAQINAEVKKYEIDQKTAVEMAKLEADGARISSEYAKALDVTETQVAGNIATIAMKEDQKEAMKLKKEREQVAKEGSGGVGGGMMTDTISPQPDLNVVGPPTAEPLPEMSPEQALATLGFE